MTVYHQEAVDHLARALTPAEKELEDAILANSHLTCAAIETRRTLGLHPSVGHAALEELLQAKQDIVSGLTKTLRVHRFLEQVAKKLDVAVAYGGTLKDQDDEARGWLVGSARQGLAAGAVPSTRFSPALTTVAA